MSARLPVAALLVLTLAFLAAGCGGKSASPEEQWAESVCSPLLDWRNAVQSAGDDIKEALKSPSASTAQTVRDDVDKASTATQTMVDDLSKVGPAPGDNGAKASDAVQGLVDSLRQSLDAVKAQLTKLGGSSSLTELSTALATASTQLSGAVAQAQSSLDTLDTVAGDLKQGFDDADSCKQLRKS
jgi:hypothetical protein